MPHADPLPPPDPSRIRGMLLAGALGDALGESIEFLSIRQIRNRYGPDGLTEPVPGPDGLIVITDDTQMTLFTLEGLIRGHHGLRRSPGAPEDLSTVVTAVHGAYLRWLLTQLREVPEARRNGWLITHDRLFATRAPGNTCVSALRATARDDTRLGSLTHRLNNSKGCGTVMRAAPVGLWPADTATVFRLGVDTAALTHSHPSGYLAAGTQAVLVRELLCGRPLPEAITTATEVLRTWPDHGEVTDRLDSAVELALGPRRRWRQARRQGEPHRPTPEEITGTLGGGWTAEEALAIAVCAALAATDIADGLRIAANHDGDSDSCAAVAGNILGAWLGDRALPAHWLANLELTEVFDQITRDAEAELLSGTPPTGADWSTRYPPA